MAAPQVFREKHTRQEGCGVLTYVDRDHRRCIRCRQALPLAAFPPSNTYDGLGPRCRECRRELNRLWREQNPDAIAAHNEARRIPPTKLTCTECGSEFEGRRDRLVCSRKCRDARYRRLHPEAYREKRRRKDARRRA